MSNYCSKYSSNNGRKTTFEREWERNLYDRVFESMQELIDSTNPMGCEEVVVDAMIEAFVRNHRTLQQKFISCFVDMIKKWTEQEKDMMVDLRNEDSWKFANEVVAMEPRFSHI